MCSFAETTHTPQGDGNAVDVYHGFDVRETTHTPQGDGKPFVFTLQKLLEKPFTSLDRGQLTKKERETR